MQINISLYLCGINISDTSPAGSVLHNGSGIKLLVTAAYCQF